VSTWLVVQNLCRGLCHNSVYARSSSPVRCCHLRVNSFGLSPKDRMQLESSVTAHVIRRHPRFLNCTAEVASSSLVVPDILFKYLQGIGNFRHGPLRSS
jgi:hypothetical protein